MDQKPKIEWQHKKAAKPGQVQLMNFLRTLLAVIIIAAHIAMLILIFSSN